MWVTNTSGHLSKNLIVQKNATSVSVIALQTSTLNELWSVPVERSSVKTWKMHQLTVTLEKSAILYFLRTSVSPQKFTFLIQGVPSLWGLSIVHVHWKVQVSWAHWKHLMAYMWPLSIVVFWTCYLIFLIVCLYFLLQRAIYPGWTNTGVIFFLLKCLQTVSSGHTLNAHIVYILSKNKQKQNKNRWKAFQFKTRLMEGDWDWTGECCTVHFSRKYGVSHVCPSDRLGCYIATSF